MKPCIIDLADSDLAAWLASHGQPAFRLGQIRQWIYRKWVAEFAEMANIPNELRGRLDDEFRCSPVKQIDRTTSSDDTVKWLLELGDGETIETVVIRAPHRLTVCISSQVGCPVRCSFCASGRDGLIRNLEPSEIVGQVLHACRSMGERVTHVVVMGMGEPLLNLENLFVGLRMITDPSCFGLGARHITVSTSGIVPGIRALADAGTQWNLALSLHAPDDEGRARLIPEAHRYPLADILDACGEYRSRTGRKVTFEYALIAGRNDSVDDLRRLIPLARKAGAKVNLIPCNPVQNIHRASDERVVGHWLEMLTANGVQATVRREKGSEIQAACGQLRRRTLGGNEA